MTLKYALLTKLKTRDAVEATAEFTLKHNLDLKDVLIKLTRSDLWELSVSDEQIIDYLATETRVFVNPNKHTYTAKPLEKIGAAEIDRGIHRIPVSVRSLDDRKGETAFKTLTSLYNLSSKVSDVKSGVLWELDIKANSRSKAMAVAKQIVQTQRRDQGLLANLHYEIAHIYK